MENKNVIKNNVRDFMAQASLRVAKVASNDFMLGVSYAFEEGIIASPIEQILFAAMLVVMKETGQRESDPTYCPCGNIMAEGIRIEPQFKIDKYRADFMVEYHRGDVKGMGRNIKNQVIVECDSQEFHETTEAQRRYEKKRDRDMQSLGYKVFRYTGSEIVKEPYRVASEIISFVTACKYSRG